MSFPPTNEKTAPPMSKAAQRAIGVDDGTVVAASAGGCPTVTFGNDWYCFYEHSNYGGRRLQWSDYYSKSNNVSFFTYGFQDQTSSWVNGGGYDIVVYNLTSTYGQLVLQFLWREEDHSSSTLAYPNDRADGFWTE